ncbi:MAG: sensor histidine kinase [Proteobacteria bacterium]|nr:sensor histidine kinase [Pseudomonadota bacterium]
MSSIERHPVVRWARDRAPALLGATGLLVIVALLAATAITLLPIIHEIARIERSRVPILQLLHTARNEDLNAGVAIRNVLLVKSPSLDEKEVERFRLANQRAVAALDALDARLRKPESRALLDRVRAAHARLQVVRTHALELDAGGKPYDADALAQELQEASDDFLIELGRMQAFQASRIAQLIDDVAERASDARVLLIACGAAAALTLLFMALAWRAELHRQVTQKEARIASLRSQKTALVGELHHRIKNHLQGLLGLLETHRRVARDQSTLDSLDTLHGHVLALIGIHGLQARDSSIGVSLNELARKQLELVCAGFPGVQLAFTEDGETRGVVLPPDHAVPVALMTTELVVNAIKHGAPAPIQVTVGMDPQGCPYLAVANRLSSPTTMDWPSGFGFGVGLSLLSTLSEGVAEVMQHCTPHEMIMTLRLQPAQPSAAS